MSAKPTYEQLAERVKTLENELSGHHDIEKMLWEKQDQLFKILDSLDAIVYVADMQSYEILFANRYTEEIFGVITGKTCWQVLQSDMTGPCPFCRNKELVGSDGKPSETLLWEVKNTSNGKWYSVRDRAIQWFDGRVVHLQIAIDISERKKAEADLAASEEKFRTVADFTYDWEYWINDQGNLNYISPSCERITGYRAEDFEKNPSLLRNIIHPEDRLQFISHLEVELDASSVCHLNFRIIRHDGEERWISHYCQPVYDREKKIQGRRASNRDITEQKKAQDIIKLSQMRQETLLKLYDKQGLSTREICDFVMESSLPLTGSTIGFMGFLNKDESQLTIHSWSKSVMDLCEIHDKPLVFNIADAGIWGEAVRQRQPLIINDYNASSSKKGTPEGHVAISRFMAVPLFDEGKIVAVAAVGNKSNDYDEQDIRQLQLLMEGMWQITKRKQAEDDLRSQMELIRKFTNSVSHDLKNPALAIHGLAKVLKRKRGELEPDKLENFIDQIVKSAEQIVILSEDINTYISTREAPIHLKEHDLKRIWKTIREEFVPQLKKRKIAWVESTVEIPAIRADKSGLLRVYRNLVDNALKYGGDNLGEISLHYSSTESHHILAVQNNGEIIPPGELETIFEIFNRRVDESAPAGTGLGLAIVREIAKHHRGKSWVESGADGQTIFYISIAKNL